MLAAQDSHAKDALGCHMILDVRGSALCPAGSAGMPLGYSEAGRRGFEQDKLVQASQQSSAWRLHVIAVGIRAAAEGGAQGRRGAASAAHNCKPASSSPGLHGKQQVRSFRSSKFSPPGQGARDCRPHNSMLVVHATHVCAQRAERQSTLRPATPRHPTSPNAVCAILQI